MKRKCVDSVICMVLLISLAAGCARGYGAGDPAVRSGLRGKYQDFITVDVYDELAISVGLWDCI